jgi:hypothetical protein
MGGFVIWPGSGIPQSLHGIPDLSAYMFELSGDPGVKIVDRHLLPFLSRPLSRQCAFRVS